MGYKSLGVINIGTVRPALQIANQKELPTPKDNVKEGQYEIGEEQRLAVNLALDAFEKGSKGFLLADGTGVGKTREILVVANEYYEKYGKKVLIVSENEQILKGSFAADSKALGIKIDNAKKFELCTYKGITPTLKYRTTVDKKGRKTKTLIKTIPAKNGLGNYGLVIYDEAHNLKNSDAGKSLASMKIKKDNVLFATATPMDTIAGLLYFVEETTNMTESEILNFIGLKIIIKYDPETNEITSKRVEAGDSIKVALNTKGITDFTINSAPVKLMVDNNILKLRAKLVRDGVMIRREYPFFGSIESVAITLNADQKAEEASIESYWDDRIAAAMGEDGSGGSPKNLGGQKSGNLSRWNESQKLTYTFQEAYKDYKAGKNVIIVAESVNPSVVFGDEEIQLVGFLLELEKKFNAKGVEIAKVFGAGDKSLDVARFQRGDVKVLLATPQSGGTGINLDDTQGCCPRIMYVVTSNYSGNVFQQILGRVSRRNTATPAHIKLLYTNSISDTRRKEIVDGKLATLKAMQEGTADIDSFVLPEFEDQTDKKSKKEAQRVINQQKNQAILDKERANKEVEKLEKLKKVVAATTENFEYWLDRNDKKLSVKSLNEFQAVKFTPLSPKQEKDILQDISERTGKKIVVEQEVQEKRRFTSDIIFDTAKEYYHKSDEAGKDINAKTFKEFVTDENLTSKQNDEVISIAKNMKCAIAYNNWLKKNNEQASQTTFFAFKHEIGGFTMLFKHFDIIPLLAKINKFEKENTVENETTIQLSNDAKKQIANDYYSLNTGNDAIAEMKNNIDALKSYLKSQKTNFGGNVSDADAENIFIKYRAKLIAYYACTERQRDEMNLESDYLISFRFLVEQFLIFCYQEKRDFSESNVKKFLEFIDTEDKDRPIWLRIINNVNSFLKALNKVVFGYDTEQTTQILREQSNNAINEKIALMKSSVSAETNTDVYVVDYTDKSIAVFGDTYAIREKLAELKQELNAGGYNKYLLNPKTNTKQAGWFFPKANKQAVIQALGLSNGTTTTQKVVENPTSSVTNEDEDWKEAYKNDLLEYMGGRKVKTAPQNTPNVPKQLTVKQIISESITRVRKAIEKESRNYMDSSNSFARYDFRLTSLKHKADGIRMEDALSGLGKLPNGLGNIEGEFANLQNLIKSDIYENLVLGLQLATNEPYKRMFFDFYGFYPEEYTKLLEWYNSDKEKKIILRFDTEYLELTPQCSPIIPDILKLTKLRGISIHETDLLEEDIKILTSLNNLQRIYFYGNLVVPRNIGDLKNLYEIHFFEYGKYGKSGYMGIRHSGNIEIPKSFWNLKKLEYITTPEKLSFTKRYFELAFPNLRGYNRKPLGLLEYPPDKIKRKPIDWASLKDRMILGVVNTKLNIQQVLNSTKIVKKLLVNDSKCFREIQNLNKVIDDDLDKSRREIWANLSLGKLPNESIKQSLQRVLQFAKNFNKTAIERLIKKIPNEQGNRKSGYVIEEISIFDINTDLDNFQDREAEFAQRSVDAMLEKFDWAKFAPINVWISPLGKYFVLSGHSRLEAFRQLYARGETNFEYIPCHVYEGDYENAKDLAKSSNSNNTAQTSIENAKKYREMLRSGMKIKDVEALAKKNEDNNAKYVLRLAHLNPNGKIIGGLESLRDSDGVNNVKKIAEYVGQARWSYPMLTNSHENELYVYLEKNGRINSYDLPKFLALINGYFRKMSQVDVFGASLEKDAWTPDKPLNLHNATQNIVEKTFVEQKTAVKTAIADAKQAKEQRYIELKDALELNGTRENNKNGIDGYEFTMADMRKMAVILQNEGFDAEITKYELELKLLETKNKQMKASALDQQALFGKLPKKEDWRYYPNG